MTRIPLSNTRSLSPVTASKPNPLATATSPVCPHVYPVFIEEWRKEDFLSFLSMMIFIAILHPNKNKYLSCCIWFRISGLNSPFGQKWFDDKRAFYLSYLHQAVIGFVSWSWWMYTLFVYGGFIYQHGWKGLFFSVLVTIVNQINRGVEGRTNI